MPRVNSSATKVSLGLQTVNYVNSKGRTILAQVNGGSGNTLNLRLPGYPQASRQLTGIAKRTAMNQTNVWY